MATVTWEARRGELHDYFDRTATEAWTRLTSDAPVGRIRATVRAGRNATRATVLDWLPPDLRGARVLDAGCGTGALAVELARRGANVLAVDLSPTLLALARDRLPGNLPGRVTFRAADMLDPGPACERFDHVAALDSLIHYPGPAMATALRTLAERATRSLLFTVAPRTPALAVMHAAGRLFPRANRAPAIEPVAAAVLQRRMGALDGWRPGRTRRVRSVFYQAQVLELVRR